MNTPSRKSVLILFSIVLMLTLLLLNSSAGIAVGLAQAGTETPAAPAALTPEAPAFFDIVGKVSSPTLESLPEGLVASLEGYDGMAGEPVLKLEAPVDKEGAFTFEHVELVASRVYIAMVTYKDMVFSSDVIHSADVVAGDPVRAGIVIYETTSDISSLSADRVHVFFDFNTPGKLQVVEMYVISNSNGQIAMAGEGQPLFTLNLPDGASNLRVEDGGRSDLFKAEGTSLSYLGPVYPGTPPTQILFGYDLPYPDKKATVKWTPSLPVLSAIFGVPHDGVELKADLLQDAGVRDMQGSAFQLYSAENLKAGETVDLNISGAPAPGNGGIANPSAANNNLLIGAVAGIGILLILIGVILWMKRRNAASADEPARVTDTDDVQFAPETEEQLLDAIVALDDLKQGGKISPEAYQAQRHELKEKLRQVRR